jgi:hypothetical protein
MLLAIGAYFCSAPALWAQASDSQTDEANKSWTATTDSHSENADPIRTIESHTQSGNRTLDKQSVQRRGSDGHFEPYQDIEKETMQVDAATVRTITRTFGRDADGAKTLVEVIEEEKHILPGGDSKVVRATSDPDANGNLQLVQRRIEETKRTSKDVEETKTTVMLPSVNGGLVPSVKVQERREQGANGTVIDCACGVVVAGRRWLGILSSARLALETAAHRARGIVSAEEAISQRPTRNQVRFLFNRMAILSGAGNGSSAP